MIQRIFFLILITFSIIPPALANDRIGSVTNVTGTVHIRHNGSAEELPLETGNPVLLGDTILTSEDGYATIGFIDESTLTIGGMDGSLTIDEYVFDPAKIDNGHAKFSILKASFEFVGGLLDKGEDEKVQMDLDFGSIGIRGTKVLRSMKDGECWIYLESGEVRVFNEGGEVFLKPGDGTRMRDVTIAPTQVKPWSQDNIDWIKQMVTPPQ